MSPDFSIHAPRDYQALISRYNGNKRLLTRYAIKVSPSFRETLARYATEVAEALCKTHYEGSVNQVDTCQNNLLPDTLTVDFALVSTDGQGFDLKLIEAQAYATTLHAMLTFEKEAEGATESVLSGLTTHQRKELLNKEILKGFHPHEVIMLSHNMDSLRTKFDFSIARDSVTPLSFRDIFIENNKLFYMRDGRKQGVKRIYSRVILSDLSDAETDFFSKVLEIKELSWFNHCSWYQKINKSHIDKINHISKLKQFKLSEVEERDLIKTVLKAKEGHSGNGVIISPSAHQLIKLDESSYFLQERVDYAACFLPFLSNEFHKIELRCAILLDRTTNKFRPLITMGRVSLSGMISETMISPSVHEGAALIFS